ncbi:deoxyribonuclease-2-alpha-like [Sinocyclocheilus grahami]|uniref:deoxyribonuclease-2-alpha-like n=1 Tax=Sinocyclocheilus grahami TaxID=75366 RepID=UPI0007AD0FE1|nr:PREDICTED: deoxyribonuclease-2-alpha-like [Sinocyclocheilus grahami]
MLLHVLLLLHASGGASSSISCYDDQGKPVDWFYLYKLPHPHHEPVQEGLKYLFMDGESEGWMDGKTLVNDSQSAVGRTVGPLYEGGDVGYILYNDQPPQKQKLFGDATRSCGHTKGVVVFDKQQGFWLVHSTPHFPPPKSQGQFSYPASGISNGQNFICVTYPFERFQTIGTTPNAFNKLVMLGNLKLHYQARQSTLRSVTKKPTLHELLMNGTSGSWVCVGDINRDEAEEKRGGGTVCRQDAAVWKAYRSAALQCETCSGEVQTCDKSAQYR